MAGLVRLNACRAHSREQRLARKRRLGMVVTSRRTIRCFTATAGRITSAVASALGLFLIGAAITLMTGRNALFSGLRQVGFGLATAAVTFGVGRLIGVNVGG